MKVTVTKDSLYHQLLQVSPGLAINENVAQSGCFIFKNGKITTFSEDVSCSIKTGIDLGTFVVPADKLLALMSRIPDEQIKLVVTDGAFIVKGVNSQRTAKFPKESEVDPTSGLDAMEPPEKWIQLPNRFAEALQIGGECADKKSSHFCLTCVHLSPKYIESTDNDQVVRYKLKIPISADCLVLKSSLNKLVEAMPTKMSETESWLHFRNGTSLTYSVRKYPFEKFPNVRAVLDTTGEPLKLNKGLSTASELAEIFLKNNMKKNEGNERILITMQKGQIIVQGQGPGGSYKETLQLKGYKGDSFQFMVHPKLFAELTRKVTDCQIAKDKLKVQHPNFTYIACLMDPEAMKFQQMQQAQMPESNED